MNADASNYSMASLYVGDLHADVTESILYEKFSSAGPVLSIRVCRDMVSRRSLGYAYVNFQQAVDAERALDTLNFDMIKGQPMRIMWSQRDPSLRKSGVGNIFIKNLDKAIDNKILYDSFSIFGNILSSKIAQDANGVSKGFGFIHFETEEAALKSIAKGNGMLLNGKEIYIGKFISRKEREIKFGVKVTRFTNLYVKNFGESLTEDTLKDLFANYGPITSHKIMTNAAGKSLGFGFVAFQDPDSAEKAVKEMNGKELMSGKTLYVGKAQKKAERQEDLKKKFEKYKAELHNRSQGSNLYIKNLDDSIDDARLRREFMPFGRILSAKVMYESGRSKGFGFVCYATPEAALKAMAEMNYRIVGSKPLYVAFAQQKEDRKFHLAFQQMQLLSNINTYQMNPMYLANSASNYYVTQPQVQYLQYDQEPRQRANKYSYNEALLNFTMLQQTGQTSKAAHSVRSEQPKPAKPETKPKETKKSEESKPTELEPLTASKLAAAHPHDQKQMLGERLYPCVKRMHADLAGKITGMLLEIDNSELLHMLENHEALKEKVDEAIAVLRVHQK